MRDFWTFIGGVAVGILAVTGVFAMEENDKPCAIEHDDGEMEEEDDESGEESNDGELIVRET